MKILNFFFALALAVFATASQASYVMQEFAVKGTLSTYSVSIPDMPSLTAVLDPELPVITGKITTYADESVFNLLSLSLQERYHNVDYSLPDEGLNSTKTFTNSGFSFSGLGNAAQSYDPISRVLSLSVPIGGGDGGAFCIGSVKICSSLYSASGSGLLDIVLTFDPTLTSFTGFADFTRTLTNGAVISGHYDFFSTSSAVSQVPVPAAGWLLGSALAGLAGGVRRRIRR